MLLTAANLATALLGFLPSALGRLKTCVPRDLPAVEVFGLDVVDIAAKEHRNYTEWMPFPLMPSAHKPIDFCNITITYTHPGQHDRVNVYIWLPMDDWNGRFLAQGGGGWAAGFDMTLPPSVSLGYAVATTDAGHTFYGSEEEMADAKTWLLTSPGNLNWPLLQNFAGRALDDLPKVAKQIITGFYGEQAKFSYWNGCSTGGRQGLMSAQRYPENYDGILAAAPAINWATMAVAMHWAHVVMRQINYYPPHCELETIRQAAITACDELDGVKDGVIASRGLCTFDAKTVVGQSFDCEGDTRKISAKAAEIANAVWDGPMKDGRQLWYGMPQDTPFSARGPFGPPTGLVVTECDEHNNNCKGVPFMVAKSWIGDVLNGGKEIDVTEIDEQDFWKFLHQSINEYTSILSTNDPDLSGFKNAGGKMITWHGLTDQLIAVNGTSNYYEKVFALDPEAPSFYRYFEAPSVEHCFGGVGAAPNGVLESLIKWVEQGVAPESLSAAIVPAGKGEAAKHRILCPYPSVAAYVGGDLSEAGSFECAESFDVKKRHTEL